MKNLLKYILIILMLFGIGNYNYSQCIINPNFIFNGTAQYSPFCNSCGYHNFNEPGVIFGEEFRNNTISNNWGTINNSNAVSIQQNCTVGNQQDFHLLLDGFSGTYIETRDIDISYYYEIKVLFSYSSDNACGSAPGASDEATVQYSFDGGINWVDIPGWPKNGVHSNTDEVIDKIDVPAFDNGSTKFSSTNFKLRFQINSGNGLNTDKWAFDEIFVIDADYSNNTCREISNGANNFNNPGNGVDDHYFGYTAPANPFNYSSLAGIRGATDNTLAPTSSLSLDPDEFELTPYCQSKGGSFWNDVQLDLNNDFTIEAELFFGENSTNSNYIRGSDGIAFVLQTDPRLTNAVSTGGSIGYGGLSPSLAVEFDTYQNTNNGTNDPNKDHMSIQLNGSAKHNSSDMIGTTTTFGTSQYSGGLCDGTYHPFKVEWSTSTNQIKIYLDNVLRKTETYDISQNIFSAENGIVYWGFTAATGAEYNRQMVRNVSASITVDFNYAKTSYCTGESNPVPTILGQTGGAFTATPSGIVFADASTGEINLASSSAGNYTISYTYGNGSCPDITKSLDITQSNDPYFSFSQSVYCQSNNNPTPTIADDCFNGTFSSSTGLVINSVTGEIDLASSTPGTYEVLFSEELESNSLDMANSNGASICGTTNNASFFTINSTINPGKYFLEVSGTYHTQANTGPHVRDGHYRFSGGLCGLPQCLSAEWRIDCLNPLTELIPPNQYDVSHVYQFFGLSGGSTRDISFEDSNWGDNQGTLTFKVFQYEKYTVTIVADPSNVNAGNDVSVCNGASVSLSGSGTCNGVGSISELFDQSSYGNSIASFSTSPSGNWSNITNGSGDDDDWFGESDFTSSNVSNTGPSAPHTGNDYIYFETSNGYANLQNETAILESISLTNVISFSFFYHMCGARIGTLEVQTFDGSNWNKIWERTGPQQDDMTDPWKQCTLDFTNLNVERIRVIATSMVGTGSGCCSGDIALDDIVIYTSTNNNCTYDWTTNASNGEIGWSYSSPTDLTITSNANSSHAGTYTFTVTDESGCTNTDDVLVSIISPLINAGNDVSICAGASTTLAASGANSYTWNNDPTLSSLIINNPVATPTVTTTYTVTGTDVNGCSGSDNVLVTVTPIEDASFNYNSCCYFTTDSDPTAQNIVTSPGAFSSTSGIVISNSSSGLIDLDQSLPGSYLITYTTTGTCPGIADTNILITYGNDCNTPTFTPLSDPASQTVASHLGGNEYQITPSTGSVRGAVWCDQPLNLDYSFTIEAELNFGNRGFGTNDQGADGISFVLHQNYQPTPIGGIGYAGFDPSIAIEFDTYYNSNIVSPAIVALDDDAPNSISIDHMAIQLDGVREHISPNNLLSPFNLGDIEDGNYHAVVFHWDVMNTTMKVYYENQLIGQVVRDIRNDFTGLVYWGFAASNGAAYNDHRFRYLNSSFWSGRNPTTLSDNINEWQGDVSSPTETITDPIDNSTLYTTGSWFNPCSWSAGFVPDYDTDVVIPQQSSYTNHPLVNYDQSIFINHSVLNLDMDADGDVDSDDDVNGKAFAKSLILEGDALFFIKTDDGAEIQVKD